MRPLTRRPTFDFRRLKVPAAAALIAGLISGPAFAGCPWIVQPSEAIGGDLPDYDITFYGRLDPSWTYYAFTVTDHELAWELSSGSGFAAVDERSRPLMVIEGNDRARYRADVHSVMPLTVYLVVATSPISELDAIDSAFEPARPIAVGQRSRGASDTHGPLPHRSLPGVEIHYARSDPTATELAAGQPEYQLCAYQVLIR